MLILQNIPRICAGLKKYCLLFMFVSYVQQGHAQIPRRPGDVLRGINNQRGQQSRQSDSTVGFNHRDDLADSITISYRFLDSLKVNFLDSSINDFGKVYTLPTGFVSLGNNGNAAFPVLFTPVLHAGFDPGFHAFDVYKFTIENTKFYTTTRPFTRLSYFLASGKEQVVKILQTQNIKPNWNAGIDYQLISSPGIFQTQNTNHNSYRFFSSYQGKRKRYAASLVLVGNKLASSENGGIISDSALRDPKNNKRFSVPVNLGGNVGTTFNVFSTKIKTGNIYSDFTAYFRQSYDFGKKDSIIVNDSTTNYLFYPKLRFQHTINYSSSSFTFKDTLDNIIFAKADSAFYQKFYDTAVQLSGGMNFSVQDKWKFVSNDFIIRQFPETKNQGQFIEAGLRLENFSGYFSSGKKNFYNIVLHGEYRNKTRNKKWDAGASGEFYATGFNAADFNVYAGLTRFLNARLGEVQVSFQNINRSPSYIFEDSSSFNFGNDLSTKKENITVLTASANNPGFSLMARNISIANYTYFKNFYQTDQYNGLINLTQFTASTKNKIIGHLNLYSDFIVQQTAGKSPVRVPLFYTRQRLAFEGNFFKNLNLSTGLDVRYNTPYYANNYSPVMGKFFPQDTLLISNLPKVNFFFNFRIKSFTAFVILENLNSVDLNNGFEFTNNNFSAPLYPEPGLLFRFALQWGFVN